MSVLDPPDPCTAVYRCRDCAAVGEAAETVHQEEEVPVDDHLRGVRLLHLLPAAGGRHALHHLGVPGHTTYMAHTNIFVVWQQQFLYFGILGDGKYLQTSL